MPNALVPELAVSDWRRSRRFYCGVVGFRALYERPEEGFSYLALGAAELMIDQIGLGRSFDAPPDHPFGRGLNLQIRVPSTRSLLDALAAAGIPLALPPENRWYRKGARETGQRQFVVADPDGYLLRFCEPLGERAVPPQSGT